LERSDGWGAKSVQRRVERLQRIERLRKRLHEMSAWRLAQLQWEREKLTTAHAEMIEALGEGLMAYGPLSQAGTRRLRSIEREIAVAGIVEKDLEQRTLDDGRLAKLADRFLTAAREARRDDLARRSLEELIEATLAPRSGSRKP
jgi:hypothetical protein